jgi:hypothetical protein
VWKRTLTLAPLVAILVLCGGGWVLQQAQHALYNSLPARIHAQTPLFSDALAADDGNWPVHLATADDGAYNYVNGEYKISDGWGEALLNRTYGNAAVEVTVQMGYTDPNGKVGDLGQVGLVVRAGSKPDSLVTFTIGVLGDWSLMRFRNSGPDDDKWQVLALGERSSAIHTGFRPNRLLVLMRGYEYLCYADDQLVAVAHDDALSRGQVGLWLDQKTVEGTATVGYFSHFAVYPAV